ncbi:hypothetical protein ACFY7Z_17735 [Streptomyces sp. NPDC012623]|uniref:hypothetical protein n=1 Tax=unclassified Streptomyces TaxID=2593676 RepID=UPI0036D1964D
MQPPRPEPDTKPKSSPVTMARRRMTVVNRRCVNWTLESAPWTVGTARRRVLEQLHTWRHTGVDRAAGGIVTVLVRAAIADGGRRVSVHLADEDQRLLILVLSHRAGDKAEADVLPEVAGLGATSCGTDTAEDGRRLWAVLDL